MGETPIRRRGGGEWGEGVPLPSRLGCLGERRKLPQRGPGRAPAEIELGKVYMPKKPSGGTYFTEFSSTIL